ncbi:MAG TPA: hypothetical protein VHU84_08245 [Lacipirellulaceae bacterium]|jgi:hypothetical protein|nr:hypothetical protein [Lacipirellulaceae bacterium]
MRRAILLLVYLSTIPGCRAAGTRNQARQAADPDRIDAIQSMSAAEKEASQQLNKW